jgi:hypothetical protein
LDGWLSSNSSASNRWQFRTPHDRRNVPRPRLSRFRSEPRRSSVYGRSRRCRKPVPNPSAPAFSTLEGRHSPSIAWFQALHSEPSAAKTHSIPSDSSRLRSMNSIRSAPARLFRCSTPSFRRSTSDRILLIIGRWLETSQRGTFRLASSSRANNFRMRRQPRTTRFSSHCEHPYTNVWLSLMGPSG